MSHDTVKDGLVVSMEYKLTVDGEVLDSSDEAIEAFIANHSPLPAEVKIFQAHYWNSAQAEFLETALKEDSEWAIVVDELNERLSV